MRSLLVVLTAFSMVHAVQRTSVSQYGITWTFDKEYETGQFVNGDWWVIDPGDSVRIISISPGDTTDSTGRHRNGSMLNPAPNKQGYDSFNGYLGYNSTTNVGIGITDSTPLALAAHNSLVSSISNETPVNPTVYVSYLKTAAVLTCLSAAPPAGSFRPGYSDPDKTMYHTDDLDHDLLQKLALPPSVTVTASTYTTYAGYFQRPWLMHCGGWSSRFLHPNDNIPDNYYFPATLAQAALLLHLDFADSAKTPLLINYIQVGIDLFGIIKAGQKGWTAEAGFGHGRKWPILFAGLMLDDQDMQAIGEKSGDYLYTDGYGPGNPPPDYLSFSEDAQTFYVAQSDIDITNGSTWHPDSRSGTSYPYADSLMGMPEWGIRHATYPEQSDAAWYAIYRTIASGAPAWAGTDIAARIMGAKNLWNHDAHFDYVDRYMAIASGRIDPFGYTVPGEQAGSAPGGLIRAMWIVYRNAFPDSGTTAVNDADKLSTDNNQMTIVPIPNPMHDAVRFTMTVGRTCRLVIYDHTGNAVFHTRQTDARRPLSWTGTDRTGQAVEPGMYYYRLTTDGKAYSGGILKMP